MEVRQRALLSSSCRFSVDAVRRFQRDGCWLLGPLEGGKSDILRERASNWETLVCVIIHVGLLIGTPVTREHLVADGKTLHVRSHLDDN